MHQAQEAHHRPIAPRSTLIASRLSLPPAFFQQMLPKPLDEPVWLASRAARLQMERMSQARSTADPSPPAAVTAEGGSPPAPLYGSAVHARLVGGRERGQPDSSEAELAALRLGRSAPLSFAFVKHTMMIEGRPVVVPRIRIQYFNTDSVHVS